MNQPVGVRRGAGVQRPFAARVRRLLSAVVGDRLAGAVTVGLGFAIRHWILTGLVLVVAVLVWVPPTRVAAVVLVVAGGAGFGTWRVRWPSSFACVVVWRVRGMWRASRVYRARWRLAMLAGGLSVQDHRVRHEPRLVWVRSTDCVDRMRVRMLPGQTVGRWSQAAAGLAQTFGVRECRVRAVPGRPHHLVLWMLVRDPLAQEVAPFTAEHPVDLTALPVALGEDGTAFRLRLLGSHLLVVGATGSGKGSVIWSVLAALGPLIGSGSVQVVALDPKGGVELALGSRLFSRFVYGSGSGFEAQCADALEDQVVVVRRRQALLHGVGRVHTPSAAEPLIVVVVDELASLTAQVTDREVGRRIAAALALLLSQGRAVGVTVIGSVQHLNKDVVDLRDLFGTRIGLRLNHAAQVALVFGPGARELGARADEIPENLPGVGYVSIEGVREPVRVRFTHLTDTHLTALADRYAPDDGRAEWCR